MKTKAQKNQTAPEMVFGLFSKKEAANHIMMGAYHVLSSPLGQKDPLARATLQGVERGTPPTFPWETLASELITKELRTSKDRFGMIRSIVDDPRLEGQRDLREKATSVLEELLTNAIFHSFRSGKRSEKYVRSEPAVLAPHEKISLTYGFHDQGLFLKVIDNGGNHRFEDVTHALRRCFERGSNQIDSKEGGAGLGLYMVFDAVTHWKVVSVPGKLTEVSCWLSTKKHFDPDNLTFNFFTRKSP